MDYLIKIHQSTQPWLALTHNSSAVPQWHSTKPLNYHTHTWTVIYFCPVSMWKTETLIQPLTFERKCHGVFSCGWGQKVEQKYHRLSEPALLWTHLSPAENSFSVHASFSPHTQECEFVCVFTLYEWQYLTSTGVHFVNGSLQCGVGGLD